MPFHCTVGKGQQGKERDGSPRPEEGTSRSISRLRNRCCELARLAHGAKSAGAGVAWLGSIVMVSGNRTVHKSPAAAARPDAESAEWLRGLADSAPQREAALAR